MILKFKIPKPFEQVFAMTVNVTSGGLFTGTMPEEVSRLFDGKIALNRARRGGKPGHFSSDTLKGLMAQVDAKIQELCSEREVARERIIRFGIETSCTYALDEGGKAYPNALGKRVWREGTVRRDSSNRGVFGLRFYAKPYEKVTYRFEATGAVRYEYTLLGVHTFDSAAQEDPIQWLRDLCSEDCEDIQLQEMPYTEEAALFFVGLYKWLFHVNEHIKPYLNPEGIAALATHGSRMLFLQEGDKKGNAT